MVKKPSLRLDRGVQPGLRLVDLAQPPHGRVGAAPARPSGRSAAARARPRAPGLPSGPARPGAGRRPRRWPSGRTCRPRPGRPAPRRSSARVPRSATPTWSTPLKVALVSGTRWKELPAATILPPSTRTGGRIGAAVAVVGDQRARVARGMLQEQRQRLGVGHEVGGQHDQRPRCGARELGDAAQVGRLSPARRARHVGDTRPGRRGRVTGSRPAGRSEPVEQRAVGAGQPAGAVSWRAATTEVVVLSRVSESVTAQAPPDGIRRRECVDTA